MKKGLGVYIHIPFCSSRCDYCDFATWTDKNYLIQSYIDAILNQIDYHRVIGDLDSKLNITSIFFGGGTPNYIDASFIQRIMEKISSVCHLTKETEITIECNPDFVTEKKIKMYISSGVNRVSLGVQSTNPAVLEYLGREHNPEHVYRAVELISKSSIDNFSCDLIYGSAVETLEEFESSLLDVIDLDPNHISAYALGIETGTPLGLDVKLGKKASVTEDDLADKYLLADQILSLNGYQWYEISNWAKPGFESKHNNLYWAMGDIVALGCSAHGFLQGKRFSTPRNIDSYINSFSKSIDQKSFKQIANDEISMSDEQMAFALKLRTKNGVPNLTDHNSEVFQELLDQDYISIEGNKIVLRPKGRLMAHEISIELYEMSSKSVSKYNR